MNDPLLSPFLLECNHLYKTYQEGKISTAVLRDVTFSIQASDTMAIVGSSGSGKSTLLHLLGGLDQPTAGEVIFKGKSLKTMSAKAKSELRNSQLGFIYQFHHLLPDFTALENAAMPLMIGGVDAVDAYQQAFTVLTAVGLENRVDHRPAELSGGERQRVAIARALINKPALIMADEPTGNLDQRTADSIFGLLTELNIGQQTALLVVTHDLQLAKRLNKQLEMRDGQLSQQLTLTGAY